MQAFLQQTPLTGRTPVKTAPSVSAKSGCAACVVAKPVEAAQLTVLERACEPDQRHIAPQGGRKFGNAIVWLRDELRIDDNRALFEACRDAAKVTVVFIISAEKMALSTSQFLVESLADLRDSLRKLKSDLIVRLGDSAEVLSDLARRTRAEAIYFYRGQTLAKIKVGSQVAERMRKGGLECFGSFDDTLYSSEGIPVPLHELPEDCHRFSEKLRKAEIPRPSLLEGEMPPLPAKIARGEIPRAEELASGEPLGASQRSSTRSMPMGGETAALGRLRQFVEGRTKNPRTIRNPADFEFGAFNSYIALGCVSPRRIYCEVMEKVDENSMRRYCTLFDLQLGDFLTFMELKKFLEAGRGVEMRQSAHAGP